MMYPQYKKKRKQKAPTLIHKKQKIQTKKSTRLLDVQLLSQICFKNDLLNNWLSTFDQCYVIQQVWCVEMLITERNCWLHYNPTD